MATGDIASSGMSAADVANLIGLVSPPGSSVKSVGEQDSSTTKGGTNGTTTVGPSSTTQNIGGSSSTQNIGGSTQVQQIGGSNTHSVVQDVVSPEGVNRAIQQILEGSQGLAATASGQHISGGYNSTTDMLLKNDLTARTAGTVALLNKKTVTDTTNSGSTNYISNSGSTNVTNNSGSQNVVNNAGNSTNTKTDAVTDIVKNAPYTINTNQTAQVSGNVAAGIAAGSLIYNAAGQLINKATGQLVNSAGSYVSSALGLGGGVTGATSIGGVAAAGSAADVAATAASTAAAGEIAGAGLADVAVGSGAAIGAGAAIGEGAAIGGAAEAGGAALAAGEGAGIWEGLAAAAAWIVCTELLKQGKFNKRYYFVGSKVFNSYSEIGKIGYYIWAIPCVKHLRNRPDSTFSKILESVFNWRAEYIAATLGVPKARKLWKGALVSAILYPTCWILGHACYALKIKRDYHVIYK